MAMSAAVVAFSMSVALVTAVAASLAPLTLLRPSRLEQILRSGGGGSTGGGRIRGALAIVQIAVSGSLLFSGASLLAHLNELLAADRGFRTD